MTNLDVARHEQTALGWESESLKEDPLCCRFHAAVWYAHFLEIAEKFRPNRARVFNDLNVCLEWTRQNGRVRIDVRSERLSCTSY